jgi:hypothetical protein
MKKLIKLTTIILAAILLCSCNPKEKYVYNDMLNYMWVPERISDYFTKYEALSDGVYIWGFDLNTEEVNELKKSDKFRKLSDNDIENIERIIFWDDIPEWWELNETSVFYIYVPYKNIEITDTNFLESVLYVYIWNVDAGKYFCVYWY